MALQGYRSSSGFDGINYDYLADLPEVDYENPDQTGQDFQYSSAPLSGSGGDSSGVNTSALNILADPFPLNPDGSQRIPKRPGYAAGIGGGTQPPSESNAYSMMPTNPEKALAVLKGTVYNPATQSFQPSTKYSYPGSTYMPKRFDMIDKALMFGSPNADVSDLLVNEYNPDSSSTPMKNILDNAGDVQASIMQLTHDNPTASASDIINAHHENFTGFDSSGNFTGAPVDPGTAAMNAIPDFSQPTQSVFDPGGLFSGSFSFDKGGQVSGGK